MDKLRALKGFGEDLKARGYTLNVSQNGRIILRIGSEAKPGLLRFLGPIEVKDLRAVLKLIGD